MLDDFLGLATAEDQKVITPVSEIRPDCSPHFFLASAQAKYYLVHAGLQFSQYVGGYDLTLVMESGRDMVAS